MEKEVTLDRSTVELLVRHARSGLIAIEQSLQSPITEDLEQSAKITLQSEVQRGHQAIYEAERKLFHLTMNAGLSDTKDKKKYDFSSSKTDWIEGKR